MEILKQNIKLLAFLTATLILVVIFTISIYYSTFLPIGILITLLLLILISLPNEL